MMEPFYKLNTDAVLNLFQVDQQKGLSEKVVADSRAKHGFNVLREKAGRSPLGIIFNQLKEAMVIILVVAAIISFALNEAIDAIVILIIVILNTIFGFWQEFNAEKAMAALKKMAEPSVRIRREDAEKTIPAKELVPGDVLIIEAGNLIPADARILSLASLKVQEAALTGESEPVEKTDAVLTQRDVPLAER